MSRPQEVSLARLLLVYEQRASSDAAPRPSPTAASPPSAPSTASSAPASLAEDWRASAKAHQHVEAMRGLVADVRARDPAAADAYAKRVDAVAAQLAPRRRPDYVSTVGPAAAAAAARTTPSAHDHTTASTSDAAALHPPGHQPSLGDPRRRPTAVGGPASSSRASSSSSERTTRRSQSLGSRRRGVRLDDGDRARVKAQQDLQEGLTDELVALVGGVRANATAMERSLELSRRELDRAEIGLERNVASVRSAVGRQAAAYKVNQRGGCWTWIVLFAVGVIFSWAFVVMRFSGDRIARIRA